MTTPHPERSIAAGFLLAAVALCLGIYFSTKAGETGGTALFRIFYAVGLLVVLKSTFAWGRLRGFPAVGKDGHWVLGHILRNLVMAALAWVFLLLLSAPLLQAAFNLARQ